MKNFGRYLSEVRAEMAKVIWPSWEELVGSTFVVLLLIAFLMLFLFGVDKVLQWAASNLYTLY